MDRKFNIIEKKITAFDVQLAGQQKSLEENLQGFDKKLNIWKDQQEYNTMKIYDILQEMKEIEIR